MDASIVIALVGGVSFGLGIWISGKYVFGSNIKKANNERETLANQLDDIETLIRHDRKEFLKVDALGMTRDELAAFQKQAKESGGTEGAWPEDPYEAVKVILKEWHSMRRLMLDAEARAVAAEWRSAQFPALMEINTDYTEIVAGTRNLLSTGAAAPFGVYTGRFNPFSKLALFLIEQSLRAPGVKEALAPLESHVDVNAGLKGSL